MTNTHNPLTARLNLCALDGACETLTYDETRSVLNHLLGGVSAYVPHDQWVKALDAAVADAKRRWDDR